MTAAREIWILGANGRCGRAVATELAVRQHPLVLVGRDAGRMHDASMTFNNAPQPATIPANQAEQHVDFAALDAAVELVHDYNAIAEFRIRLRERLQHSALMDPRGFTARLERAFGEMMQD